MYQYVRFQKHIPGNKFAESRDKRPNVFGRQTRRKLMTYPHPKIRKKSTFTRAREKLKCSRQPSKQGTPV